jgi:hypothetical protein
VEHCWDCEDLRVDARSDDDTMRVMLSIDFAHCMTALEMRRRHPLSIHHLPQQRRRSTIKLVRDLTSISGVGDRCTPVERAHATSESPTDGASANKEKRASQSSCVDDAPESTSNDDIKTFATFEFRAAGQCRLKIVGNLESERAQTVGVLIALYHHYLERAQNFGEAVLSVVEHKPTLSSLLSKELRQGESLIVMIVCILYFKWAII